MTNFSYAIALLVIPPAPPCIRSEKHAHEALDLFERACRTVNAFDDPLLLDAIKPHFAACRRWAKLAERWLAVRDGGIDTMLAEARRG